MKYFIHFLIALLFFFNFQSAYSQTWSKMGDGLDYPVNAITYFNGNIYAGTDLVYIYTGNSWNTVSNGMLGLFGVTEINSLAVYNNTLFAGGTFFVTTPDLNWYNYSARLDNAFWTTCGSGKGYDGSGMNDIPLSMISYAGSLYAGGLFSSAGGDPLDPQTTMYVARFDGAVWNPVGSGLDEHITDMTIYNNQLIVSGYFTNAGDVRADYIAAWDGTSWHSLGSGMSSSGTCKVTALAVHNGCLYAGGLFEAAGDVTVANIAKWDGTSWISVGDGINGQVYSLASYNGDLYAGGNFNLNIGGPGNYIAKWDGTEWTNVADGTDGPVNFLFVDDNKLYVGGSFSSAGDQQAKNIAVWSQEVSNVMDNYRNINQFTLYQNYPNPFNPETVIKFNLQNNGFVTLKVYDILGNNIKTIVNEYKTAGNYEITFNASSLTSGVYFYKMQSGSFVQTKKLTVIK